MRLTKKGGRGRDSPAMPKKLPRPAAMTKDAFRALLNSHGLSYSMAAGRLGYTKTAVSNWARGVVPISEATAALIREKIIEEKISNG